MNLSAHAEGYKLMGEYINNLDVENKEKTYKGIKTCLTFISSDIFGYLCAEKQYKIANEYNRKHELIDINNHAHEITQDATILLGGGGFPVAYNILLNPDTNDRFKDIYDIYTDGVAAEDYWMSVEIASNKAILYEVSKLIFDTMADVSAEVLEKVSHEKVRAYVKLTTEYCIGDFISLEAAKKSYEEIDKKLRDGENVDGIIRNIKKDELWHQFTREFLTKEELEKEFEEDDIYNAREEYKDNVRLGIIDSAIPFLKDFLPSPDIIEQTMNTNTLTVDYSNNVQTFTDLNLESFIKYAEFIVHPSLEQDDAYKVHKFISTITNVKNSMSSSLKYDNENLFVIIKLNWIMPDMSYLKDTNVLSMVNVKIPTVAFDCMRYLYGDDKYLYCTDIEFNHVTNTLTFRFPHKEEEK